jgi:hypothetical protein
MKKSIKPIYRISMAIAMLFISLAIHAQRFVNIASERKVVDNLVADDNDVFNSGNSAGGGT